MAMTFKKKMTEAEALRLAKNKNDWLWGLLYHNLPLAKLELVYIEYIIVKARSESEPSLIEKLRGKQGRKVVKTFEILFNGTSGRAALIADMPEMEEKEFSEEDRVQYSGFEYAEIDNSVRKLVHKLTHRHLGGHHLVEIVEMTPVFRPFYAAYYGEYEIGKKVRYITLAADYGRNTRAR